MSYIVECLIIYMKRVTDSKYVVSTLVKIKHRVPETRINPHLICLSRLEQIRIELTAEYMDARISADVS